MDPKSPSHLDTRTTHVSSIQDAELRGIDRMLSTMGHGWFDYCIFCNTSHPSKYYPALYYTRATEDIELRYINEKATNEEEKSELIKQFNSKYGNRTYYLVSHSQSKNILLYMDGQIQAPDIIYYAQLSGYRNTYSSYGEDWKSSFLAGSVYISPIERVGTPKYTYYDLTDNEITNPFTSLTKAFESEERGCINYRILRPSIKVAEMVAFPTRSIVFMLEGGLVDYVSYTKKETDFDAQKTMLAKDIGFSVAQRSHHTLLKTNLDLAGKYPEYFMVPFNDRNIINIETVRFGGSKIVAVIEGLGNFSMTPSTLYHLETTIKLMEGPSSCYCKNNCLYYVKHKTGAETILISATGVIAFTGPPEKYEHVFTDFVRVLSIAFTHNNFAKAIRGMRLIVRNHWVVGATVYSSGN